MKHIISYKVIFMCSCEGLKYRHGTKYRSADGESTERHKESFSKSNVMTGFRNNISFHTDMEHLLKVFNSASADFVLNIFVDRDTNQKRDFLHNPYRGADMLTRGSIMHFPSS